MGIQRVDSLLHYNYFLALEQDLEKLSRYVDFGANDQTYSIEIARLLMIASAECDVLLKQLCKKIDKNSNASAIGGYHNVLSISMPDFLWFEVTMPRFGLSFTPWINWSKDAPPFWWAANNKVKHHRYDNFNQATLKQALNAAAALFSIVLHFYRDEAKEGLLSPMATLFCVPYGRKATQVSGERGVTRKYIWPGDNPIPLDAEILQVVKGEIKPAPLDG